MKKILISTIVRNREEKLENYYNQIKEFVEEFSNDFEFSISIYENDSFDNSKEILKSFDYSIFSNNYLQCEDIGTEYYGSFMIDQRVINFANARNKTIENVDLSNYDNIMIIEVDVIYNTDVIRELLYLEDFKDEVKISEPDIYSGILLQNNIPYDLWAIRSHPRQQWGDVNTICTNGIKKYWSTANGVCVYNMKPFIEGLKFSSFSEMHNKHDCDTAVLCEDFRKRGYNKVYINHDLHLYHERPENEGEQ